MSAVARGIRSDGLSLFHSGEIHLLEQLKMQQVQEESDNLLGRIRRGRCFIDGGNSRHQVKLEMDLRWNM